MLSINQISIHFAGRYLFDKVTFAVKEKDRIGLIGRNGNGKSTLLKIMAGQQSAESGSVSKPNSYTIGYLPQEMNSESENTIFEEAATSLAEIQKLQKRLDEITEELNTRTDYESDSYSELIHELTEAHERLDIIGAGTAEAEIEQVLIGLGFLREEFSKKMKEFSGGWQMRVELAKILLANPNCILLDEPTNHLDIESIRWIENFLKNYNGSLIIVSHDQRFLDNITNRTIEISKGKIYDMPLSYSKFIEARVQQRELQLASQKNQQRSIAQTERFIERFKAKATFASRAQSKQKMLDKMEIIEVDEEDTTSLNFRFPAAPRSGRVVAETHDLLKSYDGKKVILNHIEFAIERGEKLAFVGKNGEGKSTLSKILAGMEPYTGELTIGHNVSLGYYSQHQAHLLEGDQTVFDVIERAAQGESRTKIRSLLGAFLFSGDDVYKKVKVLSGGEKSRLALAKLLLEPVNFLIMDEPTNHLDMVSKEVLKNALINYDGTLVIVSHDRDFLSGITDKTVYFKGGKTKEYPGLIDEFIERYELEQLDQLNEVKPKTQKAVEEKPVVIETKAVQETQNQNKNIQKEKQRLEAEINKLEMEIEGLELDINETEKHFEDADFYKNPDSTAIETKFKKLKASHQFKTNEWEKLLENLDQLINN